MSSFFLLVFQTSLSVLSLLKVVRCLDTDLKLFQFFFSFLTPLFMILLVKIDSKLLKFLSFDGTFQAVRRSLGFFLLLFYLKVSLFYYFATYDNNFWV